MLIKYLAAIAMVATFSAVSAPAYAQVNYPTKPVRMIVPFPAGQATDVMARLLADSLSKIWRQPVVVFNQAGVPGMLAGRDALADGYTITVGTSGVLAVTPNLYSKPAYVPKDFVMINAVSYTPMIITASPSSPYNTLKEMIDAAKKEPGKLNIGYGGVNNTQHLTGELFKFSAGIDMVGINYKGSAAAVTDLLGGQILLLVDSLTATLPHIKSGKIKPLAIAALQRAPQLPDVPTIAELGYPGFEGIGWQGLIVPKGTPQEIVDKISVDVRRVLSDEAMRERIIDRGLVVDARGSQEFTEFVNAEFIKWGGAIRRANLKAD